MFGFLQICSSSQGFLHIKHNKYVRIFVLLPPNIGQKTSNQILEDIITQRQEDLCLNPKFSESQFIQMYNEANNTWFTGAWEINTIESFQPQEENNLTSFSIYLNYKCFQKFTIIFGRKHTSNSIGIRAFFRVLVQIYIDYNLKTLSFSSKRW